MTCYTYLVRCADGSLYCGWTNNLKQRIEAHNSGRGARYTRSRRPVVLVYYEEYGTKHDAMSREVKIKQLTRAEKEQLILGGEKAEPGGPAEGEYDIIGGENV